MNAPREPTWREVYDWTVAELLRTHKQLEDADDLKVLRRLQGQARALRRVMNLPNILAVGGSEGDRAGSPGV